MEQERFLYFADGGAADGTLQGYTNTASNFRGVTPVGTTTTAIYFNAAHLEDNDVNSIDRILVTHNDTSASTGHRCKVIAKAMAEACNASLNTNGVIDVMDVDNSIYYPGIDEIQNDTSFGIAIVLDFQRANSAF